MTLKLAYRVVESREGFEVREYEPFVSIEIDAFGDWLQAGNWAFRPLVGFISGQNTSSSKFAMTAPVLQSTTAEGQHRVGFVLPVPADGTVPDALDPRLHVVRHARGQYAAITFRGRWSETLFLEKAEQLKAALAKAGFTPTGSALTARNDPPWKPGFTRTNEILIPITR